jgi:hypothetical protein
MQQEGCQVPKNALYVRTVQQEKKEAGKEVVTPQLFSKVLLISL